MRRGKTLVPICLAAALAAASHTDADREWAYDRQSHIGRLDKAWDDAIAKGWLVVDMKKDWKRVFPGRWREAVARAKGWAADDGAPPR
jgi:hypothetical protein